MARAATPEPNPVPFHTLVPAERDYFAQQVNGPARIDEQSMEKGDRGWADLPPRLDDKVPFR